MLVYDRLLLYLLMLCTLLPSAHASVCRLLAVCLAVLLIAAYMSNFVIVFVKRGVLTLLECDTMLQNSVSLLLIIIV